MKTVSMTALSGGQVGYHVSNIVMCCWHTAITYNCWGTYTQWRTEGGGCVEPPEISKALQNRAKLSPIVKTVKNC